MSAPPDYTFLPAQTLSDFFGYLETQEGFNGGPLGPGRLYLDTGPLHAPTIGYGFNLLDSNAFGAVLNQLAFSGIETVQGGSSVTFNSANVYQAARITAQTRSLGVIPSVSAITSYLEGLVSKYQSLGAATLEAYLIKALNDLVYSGQVPSGNGVPTTPTISPLNCSLSAAQAGSVLFNLVEGASLPEQGDTLFITGKSPGLFNTLFDNHGVPTVTGGNLAGLDPATPQWTALLAAYYQGGLGGASAGLAKSDPSQAWFSLRYAVNNPLSAKLFNPVNANGYAARDYLQSQVFGLNGASPSGTVAQALQDLETLQEHRDEILLFEDAFGADPNGTNPVSIPSGSALSTASGEPSAMGAAYLYTSGTQVFNPIGGPPVTVSPDVPTVLSGTASQLATSLTLTEEFIPASDLIATQLNSVSSSITGGIGVVLDTLSGGFMVRPTDILVAPDATEIANGFATSNQDDIEIGATDSDTANHVIIGPDLVDSVNANGTMLHGGLGSDILIAGAGSESLYAGFGADTLIGGQGMGSISGAAGNDVLHGGSGVDVFDFALPSTGQLLETIAPAENQHGVVEVSTGNSLPTLVGGSSTHQIAAVTNIDDVWSDQAGAIYTYVASGPGATTGVLSITGGTSLGNNEIVIDNFNLTAAESSTGFLGIFLAGNLNLTAPANTGIDPLAPNFIEGSNQSYTFSVDDPSAAAQTITASLSGASPSDFEVTAGDTIEPINSNGTFSVTLAAGETNVAFTLTDITPENGSSDIANGAALELSASLPNPDTLAGGSIQTTPLTFNYIPLPINSSPGDTINGTLMGATVPVTYYEGDQGNDYISATSGYTNISLPQSANDTVIGNGSTAVIVTGDGTSQIFAGSQTNLASAIAAASTAVGTGLQGDLIAVGHGDK